MLIYRPISELPRMAEDFATRWEGEDRGLITCWERGREKALEDPKLAERAKAGELVPLAWKGGLEKPVQGRFGCLQYLATWQGLRGEDLNIETSEETSITCARYNVRVVFTGDISKFAKM